MSQSEVVDVIHGVAILLIVVHLFILYRRTNR